MIIDAHAHIGRWGDKDFAPEYVMKLMQNSGIDLALISNLEGIGKDTDQTEANERTRQAVLSYPNNLRGLVWVNPWLAERAIANTRKCLDLKWEFVGLKFHPFHNSFYFNDAAVKPFAQLAKEYEVPMAVHTAYDDYSHPDHVIAAATNEEFAGVKFILYHAGLGPPDVETGIHVLQQVASLPNLYIDISWLDLQRLRKALDIVPTERILFGTDLPLGGEQHYREYLEKLEGLGLSKDIRAKIMHTNSRKVFTRL